MGHGELETGGGDPRLSTMGSLPNPGLVILSVFPDQQGWEEGYSNVRRWGWWAWASEGHLTQGVLRPQPQPAPSLCPEHSLRSDAIYSARYDGSGHMEVLRGHEFLSHPFAVTLYGGEVYWTDWRTNTLAKANKWTGHNVTVVQRTNTQPFDLQVYHPSRQPMGKGRKEPAALLEALKRGGGNENRRRSMEE